MTDKFHSNNTYPAFTFMFKRELFSHCKTEKEHCAQLVILLNQKNIYLEKGDELTYDFQNSIVIAKIYPALKRFPGN